MTKLMRERAAAIRAEMGKGVGPSNGSAAAPATGSTALTTQPISVLAKRPAPAVAGVSASQPGGSWATKAAPAAPPGQSLADRLGIGTVSGGIREDLEELIPGAVFVERVGDGTWKDSHPAFSRLVADRAAALSICVSTQYLRKQRKATSANTDFGQYVAELAMHSQDVPCCLLHTTSVLPCPGFRV
jgi:hypothetical protein